MSKKATKSYSTTFELFAGNYVNLYIKNIKANTSRAGKIANLSFAGYLLDEDKEYYFIGQDGDSVYAAVKKDEVAAIVLSDEVGDLMEQIEIPGDQSVQ